VPQIVGRGVGQPPIVLEMPEPEIAGEAKETAYHPCIVRMIDAQVLFARLAADEAAAALRLQHLFVLRDGQAVFGERLLAVVSLAAFAGEQHVGPVFGIRRISQPQPGIPLLPLCHTGFAIGLEDRRPILGILRIALPFRSFFSFFEIMMFSSLSKLSRAAGAAGSDRVVLQVREGPAPLFHAALIATTRAAASEPTAAASSTQAQFWRIWNYR
jgi:hypothetical protein